MLAEIPAEILHIASQFVHQDEYKEAITCISLMPQSSGIRVASTNGHIAFRCLVPYGPQCFMQNEEGMGNEPLLLPAAPFKKKVAYARKVSIENDTATFIGGKKELMEMLEARPCRPSAYTFPEQFDSLWPEPIKEGTGFWQFAFDASYVKIISTIIEKHTDNGIAKVRLGFTPTSPITIVADNDGLELQFLLMPVQVREW